MSAALRSFSDGLPDASGVAASLQPVTREPVKIRLYHYLDVLSPWLAHRYATWLLQAGRQILTTPRGTFWVDPLSLFGRALLQQHEHEPQTAEMLMRYLPVGGIFVDVGANEGYFSIQAAIRSGPSGVVWAVEPQPRCHDVIRKNCTLNGVSNVHLVPVAVSDRDGVATLYLHPATNTGATSVNKSGRLGGRRLDVQCLTLAAVLDANGVARANLLKLDIEGGEYQAILGSPAVFSEQRFAAVIVEYHSSILRRLGLEPRAIHSCLVQHGYSIDTRFGDVQQIDLPHCTLAYCSPNARPAG